MNALMSKCSEEEKSEKEEKQEINHRATKLTSKISFGPSRMGSYEDIEMENMPFKNSLAQNTFDIKRSSLEEKCDSKKDSLKESPHFTESKSDKEKENKPENLHLYEREIFKNRVNKNERDARNSEKVAQSSSISNLSHTEKHRGSVEPRIHKPTYSEKDGKVLPATTPRHQYNTSKPNGLSSQSQRSHISSRSHRGAKIVHPTSKRMAFGYNNPHLHQRLSKIRSKKKRDLKEYSKRADPILSDPNEIKKCISKGFKKIKQAKPVEMPRQEYPKSQHISCSSKRQKLLLNR